MPKYSRQKDPGQKYECFCGIYPVLGHPHPVSRTTRYRHLQEAEQLERNPPPLANGSTRNANRYDEMEVDQVGVGANLEFEGYQDWGNSSGDEERNLDEDIQSNHSWNRVGTPPPSPPGSPLLGASDEEANEDEDGFLNITAKDYCEYERWFGEEQEELNEIFAETLTEEEIDSFKMLCIRLFGHISQRNYERIRYSFKDKLKLLSTYCLHKKLAQLSGIAPVSIDCCVNICHAFTGKYKDDTHCSFCKQPRLDLKGKPRQQFEFLPTTPWFQCYFNNPEMVQQMSFQANYVQEKGAMDELYDGTRYKTLCKSEIVVEGEPQGVRFFSDKRDIAYSIMLDGVQIMDNPALGQSLCWPLMAQNLNLPASERAKLRNLIPLGIIPGPRQPKDFDSFLAPFVEEALDQARGVRTFDVTTGHHFTLRAHPIIISGDMQAIKHVIQMKGTNAKCPCRACKLEGIYLAAAKTYYIPLANPRNNRNIIPDGRIVPELDPTDTSFDPLGLPLQTHERIQEQLREMDDARNKTERDNLAKEYGLTDHLILDRIPSIQRPDSYPHEFMHLFLLNHCKELVSLWAGTHTGLGDDPGTGSFIIPFDDWCEVGRETEEATKYLASSFIRPLPNIQTHFDCYIAEHWAFWICYIGPAVLRGRLPKKYYDHFLELVGIMKCLHSINNTTARIMALRERIAHYVEVFEKYYYQYDFECLCVCKSTLHALLHVPDDVLRCGPVWVSWSFSIERYCREVTACARSMVLPWTAIAKSVRQMSQLSALACRFPELRKAMLFGKNNVPVNASRMEEIKPGYEERILRFPRLREFLLEPTVRWRIAQYFHTNFPDNTFNEWHEFIPPRCERWGKLRIRNAEDTGPGDCIRSARVTNPLSPYGKRDASFIRRDKNERNQRKKPEMEDVYAYGRLEFIVAIMLPVNVNFGIKSPQLHVLAYIIEASGAEGDAASELITFTKFGRGIVLDVSSVLGLAGRVFTRGIKKNGEWVVIDRGEAIQRTAFDIPEEAQEDEGEDEE
ncbi:unnamed protein product [Rhizoctonia solani]|uniref:Transposase family Tnp2 protein n=1 Tax=Rhizoctonia solani TaxID=456999 RepID=A0A8H3C899_9AGAM|nr:unnamed protein product [Rhizoctonia solani]